MLSNGKNITVFSVTVQNCFPFSQKCNLLYESPFCPFCEKQYHETSFSDISNLDSNFNASLTITRRINLEQEFPINLLSLSCKESAVK